MRLVFQILAEAASLSKWRTYFDIYLALRFTIGRFARAGALRPIIIITLCL